MASRAILLTGRSEDKRDASYRCVRAAIPKYQIRLPPDIHVLGLPYAPLETQHWRMPCRNLLRRI